MSVTYGFYNSIDHDRVYDAEEFSGVISAIIGDGVFPTFGDKFYVSELDGFTVTVGSGRAWFDNTWTYNDAALDLTLDTPEGVARRDVIALEVNKTVSVRENSIKIIKGTDSTTPELIQDNGIYQYPLAYVDIAATASGITQDNITNKVGTDDCPYIVIDKAVRDKLAAVYYDAERESFSVWHDPTHRLVINKRLPELGQYGLFLVDIGDSRISANTTIGEGQFKIVQESTGDSAAFQLNPSTGNLSLFHGDGGEGGYRVLLNNTKGGRHAMFRVDVGDDTSMLLNQALGSLDVRLDGATRKYRLYICSGKGSDPNSMVLRCNDSYVEMKPDESFLTVRNNGSQYITFNGNQNRLNIVYGSESIFLDDSIGRISFTARDGAAILIGGDTTAPRIFMVAGGTTPNADAGVYLNGTKTINTPSTSVTRFARGDVHLDLNSSNNRLTLTCSGGLVVNGYLGATTTFKDQSGRTVTVRNGIITSVA